MSAGVAWSLIYSYIAIGIFVGMYLDMNKKFSTRASIAGGLFWPLWIPYFVWSAVRYVGLGVRDLIREVRGR